MEKNKITYYYLTFIKSLIKIDEIYTVFRTLYVR